MSALGLGCAKTRDEQTAEKRIPSHGRSGSVGSILVCGAATSEKQILRLFREISRFHTARSLADIRRAERTVRSSTPEADIASRLALHRNCSRCRRGFSRTRIANPQYSAQSQGIGATEPRIRSGRDALLVSDCPGLCLVVRTPVGQPNTEHDP